MAGAGGVLLWLVVSFLCDVVCGADFRGIGCRRVRGGGHWGACLWWCGRAVVSVTTRFYRGGFAVNIL